MRDDHWNLPPPPGFQGLRDDLPLVVYHQSLPHWRQDGATYFVTFRLHDSLPAAKLNELRQLRAEWERTPVVPREVEVARRVMRLVEAWLDRGMGSCCLRDVAVAQLVTSEMHSTDGVLCELACYAVMPNHIHAIVRPPAPSIHPLERILRSWKGSSARAINEHLQRAGSLWQRESFDRIIRDEEHLWRAIQYIGSNPVKAGLQPRDAQLWMRPDWIKCGWGFEGGA